MKLDLYYVSKKYVSPLVIAYVCVMATKTTEAYDMVLPCLLINVQFNLFCSKSIDLLIFAIGTVELNVG